MLHDFGFFSLDMVNVLLWRFRILLCCCEDVDGFCLQAFKQVRFKMQILLRSGRQQLQSQLRLLLVCSTHVSRVSQRLRQHLYLEFGRRLLFLLSGDSLSSSGSPGGPTLLPLVSPVKKTVAFYQICSSPALLRRFLWPKPQVSVLSIICLLSLTLQSPQRGFLFICFVFYVSFGFCSSYLPMAGMLGPFPSIPEAEPPCFRSKPFLQCLVLAIRRWALSS